MRKLTTSVVSHTPGPWELSEEIYTDEFDMQIRYYIVQNKKRVIVVNDKGVTIPDARLIAAAPELLAMLKAANAAFFGAGTRLKLLEALKDSKALIHKAEGGQ